MSDENNKHNSFWLETSYGKELLECEQHFIASKLRHVFGLHILQIGLPFTDLLAENCRINHRVVLSNDRNFVCQDNRSVLYANDYHIPLKSESIDAIVLAHSLEFSDDPKAVLREIDRILLPEGLLIMTAFNPWSLWGLRARLTKNNNNDRYPWDGSWLSCHRLCDWFGLLNYKIEDKRHFYFKPFVNNQKILNTMRFFEQIGKIIPVGAAGFYIVAKKKREAMLTLRAQWQNDIDLVSAKNYAEPSMKIPLTDNR